MSILIKGMEMPKDGTFSIVHIYSDGHVSMPFWGKGMQIVSGITAVPVPPHGRLIDADALMKEFEKAENTMAKHGREYSCSFLSSSQEISTEWYCVEDMLDNAPTIIEAEEGE